jgi:hypothetical protein
MKVVNQVNQTNDYSIFKDLEGNRKVNELHVKRLKKSFEKEYLFSPIIVNEKFEIIDGQHRFKAAKEMDLPINYTVVHGYDLNEVQALNANSKNWNKLDYLNAYCDLGYESYIQMRQFMRDYPDFGVAVSEMILTAKNSRAGGDRCYNFNSGDLVIEDIKTSYDNAEKIMMFKGLHEKWSSPAFVSAILQLFEHPNYDHSHMIRKIKLDPSALVPCVTASQYKIVLEDIFNYKSRNKVSLRY